MGILRKNNNGFTLIELMIVVAIVGILAAIAVPLFMDAMRRARTTEAQVQLNKLGKRALEEYNTNSSFPIAAAALTPAANCCTQNVGNKRRCALVPAEWNTPEWQALDFALTKEFLFQYSYTPSAGGVSFQALAVGDLDCDGTSVTYQLNGTAPGGAPTTTLIEPPSGAD